MDAIVIRNATKRFRKKAVARTHSTFKTELVKWLRGQKRPPVESWIEALRGVDLTIPQGKTVGIIGRNGAGKSTLLKLMTGIYAPSSGTVVVNGRISALLELGAGFHPDFSGRENILINGIILGRSRNEVRARMSEIIEFSELGDFIEQPVRTYSSGMYTRLAFSVATHVDPDILIIDEILAVGDEHFFRKSRAKMEEFKRAGKTIVLVTHALSTVESWCDQAAWIDEGKIRQVGNPREVVGEYMRTVALAEQQQTSPSRLAGPITDGADLSGAPSAALSSPPLDSRIRIEGVRFINGGGQEAVSIDTEGSLDICIDYVAPEQFGDFGFQISMVKAGGIEVFTTDTFLDSVFSPQSMPAIGTVKLRMKRIGLIEGTYFVEVVARSQGGEAYGGQQGRYSFQVHSSIRDRGVTRPPHQWAVEPRKGPG
jgi:lipopolysaccharide transport system ATP-binding protein